jgi:imidazole glycerol-phosphate synthase subunit HisH
MIIIIDYGHGNLYSIAQALTQIGAPAKISADPQDIAAAERIILPGVGAFGTAMRELRERSLVSSLHAAAKEGKPILGICLGMQLLAERSEEFGDHQGLGLIPGYITLLPKVSLEDEHTGKGERVPNVGWRALNLAKVDLCYEGIADQSMVYFVHSFYFCATQAGDVTATIPFNGEDVTASVRRDNILGFQFHPENSGPVGLDLLRRFVSFQPVNQ